MEIIKILSLILVIFIFLRSAFNLIRIVSSIGWLQHSTHPNSSPKTPIRFTICIPALEEQDIIARTLDVFLAQEYPEELFDIYVVTTSKEQATNDKKTTLQTVEDYIRLLPDHKKKQLHAINYPRQDGHMAHQINFLSHKIKKELSKTNSYFAIYNADSSVHKKTLVTAAKAIESIYSKTGSPPNVLQQSAVYQLKSFGLDSRIAEGAGLHQSLWTLAHEIPRLRHQARILSGQREPHGLLGKINSTRYAHCVGHGLFVRGSFFQDNPLPEDVLNEDLAYGLSLGINKVAIHPIPILELARTPSKTIDVFRQKSVWFNPFYELKGVLQTPGKSNKQGEESLTSYFLLSQAILGLTIWLIHSPVLWISLYLSFLAGELFLTAWMIAFSLYWLVPAAYFTRKRQFIRNGGHNSYISILYGAVYVLTHSVGPFWSTVRWILARLKGEKPNKPRTKQ